ncbi:hypothetical protein BU17DRAFT_69114 [Hysterangium stoloniferum]|nr:hypothetical protein BU17DRAFT_69114 [Hysterangium stoloniferum]
MSTPHSQSSPSNRHNASFPPSPQSNRSEFEALIELLGTESAKPPTLSEGENSGLRDEEGRLDFAKIRTMFSASPSSQREFYPLKSSGNDTVGISYYFLPSSLLIFSSLHSPPQPDLIDLSSDEMNRASNSLVAIENQPLLPLSSSMTTPVLQSNFQERSRPDYNPVRVALDLANKEVEALRMRCQELESLIHGSRDRPASSFIQEPNGYQSVHRTPLEWEGCQDLQRDKIPEGGDMEAPIQEINGTDELIDINSLTYPQAKHLLKYLFDELGLPLPSAQAICNDDSLRRYSVHFPAASTLRRIHRAVDLVIFVDELVWRRSRLGSDYDDPHSEENMEALKERLALWEKTVRTRI